MSTTTVILVGGNERVSLTYFGERLAKEVNMRGGVRKILSCHFAKVDREERKQAEELWRVWFKTHFPVAELDIAREETFYQQLDKADLVYLHGGSTADLIEALPDFENVKKALSGKLVVGGSAGANYLARHGYSPSKSEFFNGSGLVDVSLLVHYGSKEKASYQEWQLIARQLQELHGRSPLCLSEGEYAIFEV